MEELPARQTSDSQQAIPGLVARKSELIAQVPAASLRGLTLLIVKGAAMKESRTAPQCARDQRDINSITMFTSTGRLMSPAPGKPCMVARSVSRSNVSQSVAEVAAS